MHTFCAAQDGLRNTSFLGPVYMEKSCPEKEGHPPSRVNFSKCLYEKKVDPFAQANSACLALTELNRLGEPKCLHGEMLARLRG